MDAVFVKQETKSILPFKTKQRVMSLGEMHNSDGGVYNPGAVVKDGLIYIMIRRDPRYLTEIEHYYLFQCYPTLLIQSPDTDEYTDRMTLEPVGFAEKFGLKYRIEDFRLFISGGEILCNHVLVYDDEGELSISPVISRVNLKEKTLEFVSKPDLPVLKRTLEKNWTFFELRKKLYCLYAISPYRLFVFENGQWAKVPLPIVNIGWKAEGYISVSSNPILVDDKILVWFHSRNNVTDIYHQGAALINLLTLEIEAVTQQPILEGGDCEGKRKGILYVSSCVYLKKKKIIRAYYGEGDAHTAYVDYDKNVLMNAIRSQPFTNQ